MWKLLGTYLLTISPALAAKVLTALGITVFTYSGVITYLNGYIDNANISFGQMSSHSSVSFAFLSIAGFTQAFGILSASYAARVSLLLLKRWGLA